MFFFPSIITGNEKPRISEICRTSHLQSRDTIQIDATFGHSLIWYNSVYNFTFHVNIKSFCALSYAAIMVSLIGYTFFPGIRGAAYAIQLKLFLLCANRRQVWTDFFAKISHNHKSRQKQKKTMTHLNDHPAWPLL